MKNEYITFKNTGNTVIEKNHFVRNGHGYIVGVAVEPIPLGEEGRILVRGKV